MDPGPRDRHESCLGFGLGHWTFLQQDPCFECRVLHLITIPPIPINVVNFAHAAMCLALSWKMVAQQFVFHVDVTCIVGKSIGSRIPIGPYDIRPDKIN